MSPVSPVACNAVQEALPAYLAGEAGAEVLGVDTAALDAHLESCAGCRAEQADAAGVRELLTLVAPVAAEGGDAAGGLAQLLAAAAQTPQDGLTSPAGTRDAAAAAQPAPAPQLRPVAQPLPLRAWIASAAAAALVLGTALGVSQLDLSPRPGDAGAAARAPGVLLGALQDVDTGAPVRTFAAGTAAVAGPAGATVGWSDRWTLALRSASAIAHTPGGLRLDAGEAVLHVVPGRGRTTVRTPHAAVTVLGTVLSIDVTDARTIVAVYSGSVRVDGTAQSMTVDAGRAVAVAAGRAPQLEAAAPAPPDWLPAPAVPTAVLQAPAQALRAGTPAWTELTLTNPGPGLCVLVAANDRDPLFKLAVRGTDDATGASDTLVRVAVQPMPGRQAVVGGRVVLGPGDAYRVRCNVGSALPASGRYAISARYDAPHGGPAGAFVGTAASPAVAVDVGTR